MERRGCCGRQAVSTRATRQGPGFSSSSKFQDALQKDGKMGLGENFASGQMYAYYMYVQRMPVGLTDGRTDKRCDRVEANPHTGWRLVLSPPLETNDSYCTYYTHRRPRGLPPASCDNERTSSPRREAKVPPCRLRCSWYGGRPFSGGLRVL